MIKQVTFTCIWSVVFIQLIHAATRVCDPIDQCSCKWADTGKKVSLWGINDPNGIRFKDQDIKGSSTATNMQLDYSPCTPFTEKDCIDSLSCQHDKEKSVYYPAGDAKSHSVSYDGTNLVFTYKGAPTADKYVRYTNVTLKCDLTKSTPLMSQPVEIKDQIIGGFSTFVFDLTSKCACDNACEATPNTGHNLSVGSILCILFFVLLLVYFIGGFLFLKFYKHNEGTEAVPQYEFWKDLPAKIKDGFIFTKEKVTRKGGEYEAI